MQPASRHPKLPTLGFSTGLGSPSSTQQGWGDARGSGSAGGALAAAGQQQVFGEAPAVTPPFRPGQQLPSVAPPHVVPMLAERVRPRPIAGDVDVPECSVRQLSPLRSTAVPSSHSSRHSSTSSSSMSISSHARTPGFGAMLLDAHPLCPAPPPDVDIITAPQPARSQAMGGGRHPTMMEFRSARGHSLASCYSPASASSNARSRGQSGSRTPEPPRTEASASGVAPGGSPTSRHHQHVVSSALESAAREVAKLDDGTLRLSRCGWGGGATAGGRDEAPQRGEVEGQAAAASSSSAASPIPPPPSRRQASGQVSSKAPAREYSAGRRQPSSAGKKAASSVGPGLDAGDGGTSSAPATSLHAEEPKEVRSRGGGQKIRSRGSSGNPRHQLNNGSRDDSFLSTISESTRSSDSTSTDEKQKDRNVTAVDGSRIEVYSASTGESHADVDVLKDFRTLFSKAGPQGEEMAQQLRQYGFDKPLEMQRRVVPLVMSAFTDEQKTFMTIQGAPQCGKTSALVLGILGAIGPEVPGIRAVVLSTCATGAFQKYFGMCAKTHPLHLECFENVSRRVTFEGIDPDPEGEFMGFDPMEDLRRLSSVLASGSPAAIFGQPARALALLREAPSWGVDLSNVQVLALDDVQETIRMGLMDEVCEVCTILRHFSKQRLRHIVLSHFLSHDAKSMIRCLRDSLLRQQNLFGIRAHRTQARAKCAKHYYAVAPRSRWPAMLAALHHALNLPSGIIFDDASAEARALVRTALRAHGVTASVWNALQEQGSGARAAARDGAATAPRGPAFHLMPSDLVVLKVDLPQVRCVLHFEVPRRELSIYGLRLLCLEQAEQKSGRKAGPGGRSISVLFVEEEDVVRELERTFRVKMQEVPTEMLVS